MTDVIDIDGESWVPRALAEKLWRENRDLKAQLAEKQRSTASHNQQFAEIHDIWENLPESMAGLPYAKSADHFRKHGLIVTGHCDVETVDCGNEGRASAAAPLIADLARKAHGYALIVVRGPLVVCTTPHSQSYKAMGKDTFQKSKADVLEWARLQIGA